MAMGLLFTFEIEKIMASFSLEPPPVPWLAIPVPTAEASNKHAV